MSLTLIAALFFTVVLFATTTYFLMGSVPLLVLKHDIPMDSRFVRGFYHLYYQVTTYAACATAVSYLLAGWRTLAASAAAIALLAVALRLIFIPKLDELRAQIQTNGMTAIAAFRRMHIVAILINVGQLFFMVWSLIAVSLSLR